MKSMGNPLRSNWKLQSKRTADCVLFSQEFPNYECPDKYCRNMKTMKHEEFTKRDYDNNERLFSSLFLQKQNKR